MNHLFVALCFKMCPNRAEAIGETCVLNTKKRIKIEPKWKERAP